SCDALSRRNRRRDCQGGGLVGLSSTEIENQVADVENSFDFVERVRTDDAYLLWPQLASAFGKDHIRSAFLVRLNTLWGNTYRILFVVLVGYSKIPPAAYCLDRISGPY